MGEQTDLCRRLYTGAFSRLRPRKASTFKLVYRRVMPSGVILNTVPQPELQLLVEPPEKVVP